ncbi:MAG TPA: hypothetical protein VHG32_25125 [Thermoanaerobaculia bacterium]|jgi:hypothetical protein|nr:hypothetical protein [Thermoanaerobaculia bacterium]
MPSAPHKRRQQRGVLDDLLGAAPAPALPPAPAPTPPTAAGAAAATAGTPPPGAALRALRLTINLPPAVLERARDAVYHSPGLTLSGLSATAINREVDRLEQQRGEPFPARNGPIRTGRPVR